MSSRSDMARPGAHLNSGGCEGDNHCRQNTRSNPTDTQSPPTNTEPTSTWGCGSDAGTGGALAINVVPSTARAARADLNRRSVFPEALLTLLPLDEW
jgi:hypothetical protein